MKDKHYAKHSQNNMEPEVSDLWFPMIWIIFGIIIISINYLQGGF